MRESTPYPAVHPWRIGGEGGSSGERIRKRKGGDIMGVIKNFHRKVKVLEAVNVIGKLRLFLRGPGRECGSSV